MREFIDNKLVIASNNDGKILELQDILKVFDIHILSNRDFNITEPIEDGKTFKENAYIKSFNTASKTKLVSLSDDSGISFRALNNRPGIHSARYAGNRSNSTDNINLVLKKMKNSTNRNAQFRTIVTLYLKSKVYFFDGSIRGTISSQPIGKFGFGYDSIFIPEGYNLTFAQMTGDDKNKISHRKKAIQKLNTFLINN